MFQCRKATVLTWRRARFHHLQEHTKRNSYVDWRSRTTIHSRLLNQVRLFPREHLQPKKALYSHRWTSQHFKSTRTGAKRACLSLGHKGQLQCACTLWHLFCFPPNFSLLNLVAGTDIKKLSFTCEGGERKPARVFSVKPARKMISNIDYPIISHLSNMPTFFWAKTRQIRGADTPRGRNVPGKEAGQRQTKWHTVWCAISICHTWPRR